MYIVMYQNQWFHLYFFTPCAFVFSVDDLDIYAFLFIHIKFCMCSVSVTLF